MKSAVMGAGTFGARHVQAYDRNLEAELAGTLIVGTIITNPLRMTARLVEATPTAQSAGPPEAVSYLVSALRESDGFCSSG